MNINIDHLYQSLELMVLGMAGVFLVLGILYASAVALLKIFPVKK
ncbi:OadG-related small transporter subunit [Streptococcus porci]|nr:OadG-related small transporter subunit [Streptococcus porci]